MIECSKNNCGQKYIGETERSLKERIMEHVNYIKNRQLDKPTGNHFNKPGHTLANMKVVILEKVEKNNEIYRKDHISLR